MRTDAENKIGSTIYSRIQAVPMPEADRQRALNVLYDAERIVDGFAWVVKNIERLAERLFHKPAVALKH